MYLPLLTTKNWGCNSLLPVPQPQPRLSIHLIVIVPALTQLQCIRYMDKYKDIMGLP